MVEHVSAREQQYRNQRDRSPQVAVLDDGQDIRGCHGEESDETEDCGGDDGDFDVVDWTDEGWVRAVGEMAGKPGVDGIRFVGAENVISRVFLQV